MKVRSLAIGAIVILAVVLGLWGVWVLESGYAARGTAEDGAEFTYQLADKGNDSQTDIILFCPEDHMAEPSEAFSAWLKLDGIPMTVPGGTMLLAKLNDVTLDDNLKPLQRAFVEVLKRYSPRRVVLVAHTYCVYYDTLAAWNDNLSGVRTRQIEDLEASMQVLQQWFPRAKISGYLAEEDPDHKLVFHSVDKLIP
jgi:hypothetical protein